jgi:thiamine pyrophosphate-dependent acetolactate synthase large subunit-like protein
MTEADAIRMLMESSVDEAVVVANGYLSRHAFQCRDLPSTFYMIGSMGLASSIGLGVALAQPERRVVVVDGDGNLLMSLGALAMIGNRCPANLIHIVIDNEVYASTGGQHSISGTVSMPELALAAGYRTALSVWSETEFGNALNNIRKKDGPSFLQTKVRRGTETAPRVHHEPDRIARLFRHAVVRQPR